MMPLLYGLTTFYILLVLLLIAMAFGATPSLWTLAIIIVASVLVGAIEKTKEFNP